MGKSAKKSVPPYLPQSSQSTKLIDPKEYEEQEKNPLSKLLRGLAGITGRRAKDVGYYVTKSYRQYDKIKKK